MKVLRGVVDFNWKADTRSLHETTDSILAGDPDAISEPPMMFMCAVAERDASGSGAGAGGDSGDVRLGRRCPVLLAAASARGLLARMTNDSARAHAAFTKARLEQEKMVQARPNYGPPLCVLGLIDAGWGEKKRHCGKGGMRSKLSPVEKESIQGSQMH